MWFNDFKINGNVDGNIVNKGLKTGIYFTHTSVDGNITNNTVKNMKGNIEGKSIHIKNKTFRKYTQCNKNWFI